MPYLIFNSILLYNGFISGTRIGISYKVYKEKNFTYHAKSISRALHYDDTKLANALKKITGNNILLPIGNNDCLLEICKKHNVNYKQVYGKRSQPRIVYGDLDFTKQCSVDLYEVIEENVFNEFVNDSEYATAYNVSSILSYNTAKMSFKDYEGSDGCYGNEARIVEKDFEYYRFILLNPKAGVDPDDELTEMEEF